ncbi:MAG TPA: hypothetical protein VF795_11700 [Desulfuromonadaceae bacterium]
MTVEDCIYQCREQDRVNLEPDFCRFMRETADHLERMSAEVGCLRRQHVIMVAALQRILSSAEILNITGIQMKCREVLKEVDESV